MTAHPMRLTTNIAPSPGAVAGTISDPSGYPLAGITIALLTDGRGAGSRLGTTTTDDAGGYRFTRCHAAAGDELRVEATDHSGAHVFTRSIVTIGRGPTTTHDATMPVAGYVQGRVASRDGAAAPQPATDVCVTAAGEYAVQAAYVSTKGTFRIGGLPPGEYAVAFQDDLRFAAHPTMVTVIAGGTTTIEDQLLDLALSTG